MNQARGTTRAILASASIAAVVFSFWFGIDTIKQQSATSWKQQVEERKETVPFDERVRAGLKAKLDSSERVYQIGIAVMVALWSLIIIKKDQAGLSTRHHPE